MRPLYKNQIFAFLKESKYGIDQFRFDDADGPWNVPDRIVFRREPRLAFYIRSTEFNNEVFDFAFHPYSAGFPFVQYTNRVQSFEFVLKGLKEWLISQVDRYIIDQETPDLWKDYGNLGQISNLFKADYGDPTYFTAEETQQFLLVINGIERRMISELYLTQDQIGQVQVSMDYIRNQMPRADKLAMKLFFLGTLINLIFVLTLDTERGNKLFNIIKEVFSSIFQIGYLY